MFLQIPNTITTNIQDLALLINTVLLIVFIIIVELGFAETPKKKRAQLRYLYPLVVVLVGLLMFAAYRQGSVS